MLASVFGRVYNSLRCSPFIAPKTRIAPCVRSTMMRIRMSISRARYERVAIQPSSVRDFFAAVLIQLRSHRNIPHIFDFPRTPSLELLQVPLSGFSMYLIHGWKHPLATVHAAVLPLTQLLTVGLERDLTVHRMNTHPSDSQRGGSVRYKLVLTLPTHRRARTATQRVCQWSPFSSRRSLLNHPVSPVQLPQWRM
ncbi:hypothetical protein MSAN_01302900 [Mycena sanguinolenta]|uniref:Uncharacterized protein n=1 Tax=Mycena sanguinolenta TaxID=230812 RepID=A0A8H7D371_9AGAR|nr:hypothetical protein MSAN_01302900 [Mycena sanguinolenta]